MADQSKTTIQLPIQNAVANTNDKIIFVYSANTNLAQTSLIAVSNLFGNTPNLQIKIVNIVIANVVANVVTSNALVIPQGTLMFSANYGYFAIANNYVRRFFLSDF